MQVNAFNELMLFKDLSPSQRDVVLPLFTPCSYPEGMVIFEQGEATDYLYIVVDGEIQVRFKPDDGPPLIVARVRNEGVVGWSAALGSPAYTSAAVCATNCDVLRVRGTDLRTLCEQYPETGSIMLERLADVIAKRLRNTHAQVIALLEQGLRVNGYSVPQNS
ncbi:MAG: Crp/Fnr family transcriptional regulator [Anaerolineales bacterium]|jgi:CRP/FNR family cyclic AMP-dependent transcriptional regulator